MMRIWIIILCLFIFPTIILGQFGELPPDPISTISITGVKAEITIHLRVDKSNLLNLIPEGFVLSYPAEYYSQNLKKEPDTIHEAFVTLLIIIADSIVINNVPIKSFDGSIPAFSTVWYSTEEPSFFTIYTYYGHYVQECDIHIETSGRHKLINLVQDGLNKGILSSNIQSKWRAKAGIYRR